MGQRSILCPSKMWAIGTFSLLLVLTAHCSAIASEMDLREQLADLFPTDRFEQLTVLPVAPPQAASPIPSGEIAEIIARVAWDAVLQSEAKIRVLSASDSTSRALEAIYQREGREDWQRSVVRMLEAEADLALIGEASYEGGLLGLRLKLVDLGDGSLLGATETLPLAVPRVSGADPVSAINDAIKDLYGRVPEARTMISVVPFSDGLTGTLSPAGPYFSQIVADAWLAAGSGINEQIRGAPAPRVVFGEGTDLGFRLTGTIWRYDTEQTQLRVSVLEGDAERASERIHLATGRLPPQVRATLAEDFMPAEEGNDSSSLVEVFPRSVSVGDELAMTVEAPANCDPAFFDVAKTGRITPIPVDVFDQTLLPEGMVRFEISLQGRFGLVIQESDDPGSHAIGFLCRGFAEDPERDILRRVWERAGERRILAADKEGTVLFHFSSYEVRQ